MQEPKFPPPCFDFLNAQLLEMTGGVAVVRFTPSSEMENPYGLIQGGILAGMIDNIIGPAVVSVAPDRQSSTIQMTVNYLRSVKAGEKLIGTARVIKHGRTQAFVEATLEWERDKALLVKASATNVFLDPVDARDEEHCAGC